MNKKIVGIGYCPIDELIVLPSYPVQGEKITLQYSSREGGGAAATAMVVLSMLGAQTFFISRVGNDEQGRFLIDGMEKKGVNCDYVQITKEQSTNRTIILIDSSTGKATVITEKLRCDETLHFDVQKILMGAFILHLDGHFSKNALSLAKFAKAEGILISIDAGRYRPGIESLLKLSDIIITSKSFALDHASSSSPREALSFFKKKYNAQIIGITLQKAGAICWSKKEGEITSEGIPVKVIDDSSSGDIFHGAFLYGVINSWPLHKTLTFANGTAAYSCKFYGGRNGIPKKEKNIWEFISQYNTTKGGVRGV
jgi:sulfofructose kinase